MPKKFVWQANHKACGELLHLVLNSESQPPSNELTCEDVYYLRKGCFYHFLICSHKCIHPNKHRYLEVSYLSGEKTNFLVNQVCAFNQPLAHCVHTSLLTGQSVQKLLSYTIKRCHVHVKLYILYSESILQSISHCRYCWCYCQDKRYTIGRLLLVS